MRLVQASSLLLGCIQASVLHQDRVEVTGQPATAHAAEGQGICLLIETSTIKSSASDGYFGFTVKTSGNKISYFTLQASSAGEIAKYCDGRSSFDANETIESVEVAALNNDNGWKIKKFQVDINPGTSFNSDPAVLSNKSAEWVLDAARFESGFWVDGNEDGFIDEEGSATCGDRRTCALTPLELEKSQADATVCAAEGQGICLLMETSTVAAAGSGSTFRIIAKTSGRKTSYFTTKGGWGDSGEIIKLCDCRSSDDFNADETISSVEVGTLTGSDGWKIKQFQVDINPGSSFNSSPAVLSSKATKWGYVTQWVGFNDKGFWLDGDNDLYTDSEGSTTCGNHRMCLLTSYKEVSESTVCNNASQGICVRITTANGKSWVKANAKYGFTVTTSGNKITYFTFNGGNAGEVKQLCDCRSPNTFSQGESITAVDAAAISSSTDGWKIQELEIDNPAGSYMNKSSWLLDVNNHNGFWLDGNDDGWTDDDGTTTCGGQRVCPLSKV